MLDFYLIRFVCFVGLLELLVLWWELWCIVVCWVVVVVLVFGVLYVGELVLIKFVMMWGDEIDCGVLIGWVFGFVGMDLMVVCVVGICVVVFDCGYWYDVM